MNIKKQLREKVVTKWCSRFSVCCWSEAHQNFEGADNFN